MRFKGPGREHPIKAVLFDLDETLLDRNLALRRFCRWQAAEQLGLDRVDDYVSRFMGLDAHGSVWKDRVYWTLKYEFGIQSRSVDDLVSEYLNRFCEFCCPKAGAREALEALKRQGYKLAVVSNGKSPFQEHNLSAMAPNLNFDQVIVSGAVGLRKPEAGIFRLTCERLAVEPAQCVFVGDDPIADIRGAQSVGMLTVFIPGHYGAWCAEADAVCTDYRDLISVIEQIKDV